ncbi:hypothetical protein D9758_018490 [Tetrapyrgos nigripes]|uniref:Ricin B lectin domain-containing protein n=1 Tax=Tetrapyrgos nigripes TaxID=182062 RepID=A0A8H5APW7_9AGAR|nr:hypothetical protein D9758_018490 [Tetrapyrgos nigripes]
MEALATVGLTIDTIMLIVAAANEAEHSVTQEAYVSATILAKDDAVIGLVDLETKLEAGDGSHYADDDLSLDEVVKEASTIVIKGVIPDGTYTIVSAQGDLMWDLLGFGQTPGTKFSGYHPNGGSNQKWTLTATGDAVYTIQSNVSSNPVTYVSHKQISASSDLVIQADTNVDEWVIERLEQNKMVGGTWYIRNIIASSDDDKGIAGKYLDLKDGASADETPIIFNKLDIFATLKQQWRFNPLIANSTYKIVNVQTGTVWDLFDLGDFAGNPVQGFHDNGGDNQKWIIMQTGPAVYSIKSKVRPATIYASHVQTTPSTTIPSSVLHANTAQDTWFIEPGTEAAQYYIRTTLNSTNDPSRVSADRVLDLANASSADNNQIILWTVNKPATPNQQWKFAPA